MAQEELWKAGRGRRDSSVRDCEASDPRYREDTVRVSHYSGLVSLESRVSARTTYLADGLPIELASDRFEYTDTVEFLRSFWNSGFQGWGDAFCGPAE